MRNVLKLLALLLASALLLAGCSGNSGTVQSGCLNLDGKDVQVPEVFTVDGYTVGADEYRYYFLNLKYQIDGGDSSYWDDESAQLLKDSVREYIVINYAVIAYADRMGVRLSDEELAALDGEFTAAVEQYGGDEGFDAALAENYMTREFFRKVQQTNALQQKLYDAVFAEGGEYGYTDAEMRDIVNSEFIRLRYLALKFDESTREEKLSAADALLARARAGEDFAALVNEFGEEPSMSTNPDGIYTLRGMSEDAEFEDFCYALEENEISGIYEAETKLLIIKRLPLEAAYIAENLSSLRKSYQEVIFSDVLEQLVKTFSISESDIYSQISVYNMK